MGFCDVADCTGAGVWLCIESGFYYCENHRHSHGDPPHHYKKVNLRK